MGLVTLTFAVIIVLLIGLYNCFVNPEKRKKGQIDFKALVLTLVAIPTLVLIISFFTQIVQENLHWYWWVQLSAIIIFAILLVVSLVFSLIPNLDEHINVLQMVFIVLFMFGTMGAVAFFITFIVGRDGYFGTGIKVISAIWMGLPILIFEALAIPVLRNVIKRKFCETSTFVVLLLNSLLAFGFLIGFVILILGYANNFIGFFGYPFYVILGCTTLMMVSVSMTFLIAMILINKRS